MAMDSKYIDEEVLSALRQIHSSKAPRPDGMNVGFFKFYLPIIGVDITKALLDFLNDGVMPKGLNMNPIIMILKGKNPSTMKEFHLINLL